MFVNFFYLYIHTYTPLNKSKFIHLKRKRKKNTSLFTKNKNKIFLQNEVKLNGEHMQKTFVPHPACHNVQYVFHSKTQTKQTNRMK